MSYFYFQLLEVPPNFQDAVADATLEYDLKKYNLHTKKAGCSYGSVCIYFKK